MQDWVARHPTMTPPLCWCPFLPVWSLVLSVAPVISASSSVDLGHGPHAPGTCVSRRVCVFVLHALDSFLSFPDRGLVPILGRVLFLVLVPFLGPSLDSYLGRWEGGRQHCLVFPSRQHQPSATTKCRTYITSLDPWNHNLYIGIIIFPHITHDLQVTINLRKKLIKKQM